MNSNNGPVTTGKIWHSPLNVYWHLQKLGKTVTQEEFEKKREYQAMREARVGAVTALALFKLTGKPTYVQLYKPDPPDVLLMQPSKEEKGQMDITLLEITTYVGQPRETLLEQLKRTKAPKGFHKYSENYVIVVNIGIGFEVDFEPTRKYLNENGVPFPIWTLQEISNFPDTIAELVIVNPNTKKIRVNVGEAAHEFHSLRLPDILNVRRVAKVDNVRIEEAEKYYKAPWESVNE